MKRYSDEHNSDSGHRHEHKYTRREGMRYGRDMRHDRGDQFKSYNHYDKYAAHANKLKGVQYYLDLRNELCREILDADDSAKVDTKHIKSKLKEIGQNEYGFVFKGDVNPHSLLSAVIYKDNKVLIDWMTTLDFYKDENGSIPSHSSVNTMIATCRLEGVHHVRGCEYAILLGRPYHFKRLRELAMSIEKELDVKNFRTNIFLNAKDSNRKLVSYLLISQCNDASILNEMFNLIVEWVGEQKVFNFVITVKSDEVSNKTAAGIVGEFIKRYSKDNNKNPYEFLKNAFEVSQDMSNKLNESELKNNTLAARVDQLSFENEKLQKEIEFISKTLKTNNEVISELMAQLKQIACEKVALEEQLYAANEEAQAVLNKKGPGRPPRESTINKIKALTQENKVLCEKVSTLEAEMMKLQEELKTINSDGQVDQNEVQDLTEALGRERAEIKNLQMQLNDKEKAFDTLAEDLDQTRSLLKQASEKKQDELNVVKGQEGGLFFKLLENALQCLNEIDEKLMRSNAGKYCSDRVAREKLFRAFTLAIKRLCLQWPAFSKNYQMNSYVNVVNLEIDVIIDLLVGKVSNEKIFSEDKCVEKVSKMNKDFHDSLSIFKNGAEQLVNSKGGVQKSSQYVKGAALGDGTEFLNQDFFM